ncbi:MAG: WbqC family protein [Bacteroidia bacterium]|nr:WbqC family protein [Bacteroidia bacterium]
MFYLPPVHFFAHFQKYSLIWLEANETYQKGSFRNKTIIATSQGPLQLSIPLQKGKHQKEPIRLTRIAYDENWAVTHLRSIQTAYSNAPYYDHYFEDLESILQGRGEYLFDFSHQLLKLVISWLQIPAELKLTEKYIKDYPRQLVDLRVIKRQMIDIPPYPQVHERTTGFLSDLSIIDLIFNLGPESRTYLNMLNISS